MPRLATTFACALTALVALAIRGAAHPADFNDRPILFDEEYKDILAVTDELDVMHFAANLFANMDSGLAKDGEHAGGGGDGQITAGELSVRLLRVELQRQEADAAYHLEKVDLDRDGILNFLELPDQGPRSKMLYDKADENRDTWLSATESRRYFHPETQPGMFRFLAAEAMVLLDQDHDGNLTKAECHRADELLRAYPHEEQRVLSKLAHHFEDTDIHGERGPDGQLSLTELMHYFNFQYEGRIERHAKDLIARADDNGDGVLQTTEMENHYMVFVGPSNNTDDHHFVDGEKKRKLKGRPRDRMRTRGPRPSPAGKPSEEQRHTEL